MGSNINVNVNVKDELLYNTKIIQKETTINVVSFCIIFLLIKVFYLLLG